MSHLPTLGACSALKAFPGSVTSRLGGGYGVTRGYLSSAAGSDEQLAFLHRGTTLEVVNARDWNKLCFHAAVI